MFDVSNKKVSRISRRKSRSMTSVGKYFNYEDFLFSDTANREGYKEQYFPPDEVYDNIEDLVVNVLDVVQHALPLGKIKVRSGYRCDRLNAKVGSKPTSQHPKGMAADIEYWENGKEDNVKLWNTIVRMKIEFDQLIDEKDLSWIHISYNKDNNRNMILTIK